MEEILNESVEEQKEEETETENIEINIIKNGDTIEKISIDETISSEVENKENENSEVENFEDEKSSQKNNLEIISEIQKLQGQIENLNDLFLKRIQHTELEEKIIDRMHAELQKYKNDMYSQLVKPILIDIINFRNNILQMAKFYEVKSEGEQNIPLKVFKDYSFDIEEILEKNNIDIYKGEIGEKFDPTKQRIVKKVKTDEKDLHGKVVEIIAEGYNFNGKIISPEKVAVYIYSEKAEKEN